MLTLFVAGGLCSEAFAQPRASSPREFPELYLLIRSRKYQEAIAEAEASVKAGQYPPALEAIQWVLSRSSDVLIRDEAGEYRSARGAAEQLLQSLPATAREQYQRIQGASAAGEWARLSPPYHTVACLALVRSHFATEAGYSAAAALVSRWVDDGNADLAAALALRVIAEPAHKRRVTPAFLRRAELACRTTGRAADADRIRTTWLNRIANAGRTPPPATSHQSAPALIQDADRIAAVVPLSRPLWQHAFDSAQTFPTLAGDWSRWSAEKRDKDQPTAVAWQPVVVGRQLIFRDVQTIESLDVQTGKPLWKCATQLGAEQLLNPTGNDRALAQRLQWEYWESLFGSSLTGSLTTDGVRVYAVNDAESLLLPMRRAAEMRDFDDAAPRPAATSLIAINVSAEDEAGRLAWSTARGVGQPGNPLAGHAFLGPPAVLGGIAYCLTERDRELVLAALDAASGELLWRQPVALAERSLLEDRARSLRASIPTVARGVVLCPTNVGLLVAADAVTGEFRWYHSYLPASEQKQGNFRAVLVPPYKRPSAFAPLAFAAGARAVYLPSQSDFVYCLDVATGRELWRSPQNDADFVGGVTDDRVLVVGHSTCRSLSLETGETQWTARLETVPAGTGVLLGDGFLLPLDSGQVLALNLKTGVPLGANFSTERRPNGHLAVSSDVLVAVGGDGATAYAQAGPTLQRIQAARQLEGENPTQSLDLADVYLAQGDLMRAVEELQSALARRVEVPRRAPAENTLREVYFRLLADRPERSAEWFEHLTPLCRPAPQESRLLIALSSWHLQAGRSDDVLRDGAKLARLTDDVLHPTPQQPNLAVSIPVWLSTLERRVPLQTALASRAASESPLSPRAAEFAFRDSPLGREARAQLAREDRAAGRFHSAEVRWLRNLQQPDRTAAAQAARELADLYDAAGLSARAAEQLELLHSQFATVEISPGTTGAAFVRAWPAGSPAQSAWQRRQPIDWSVQHVQMRLAPRRESLVSDPATKPDVFAWNDNNDGLYGEFQRRFQPTQADAPYEWLLKSWGTSSWLLAFDKTASRPLRAVAIPPGAVWPAKDIPAGIGSSQTFGLPAEIRCVSLLQGATDSLAWTTTSSGWTGRTSIPLSGPATPFGAVFQLRNELLVLDPADGRLLWKRDDLEPGSGLLADTSIGLLTDDRVVLVLGADKQSFRVYDLATGELLRQPRFEREPRSVQITPTGTLVHQLAETSVGRFLRLWDVANDELLLEEPVRDRGLFHQIAYDKDLVWITPEGRLRVFDMASRKRVVDCLLSPDELEGVLSLKALRQGERYIVNLGRNSGPKTENVTYEQIRDPMLPAVLMNGELIAVEPGCDHVLWRVVTPYRSFVPWGRIPAPVLVGASIVKSRPDNQRRWLVVEALDPATGLCVGFSDQLPETRLYHADYDGAKGVIRLVGDRGDIELHFDKQLQQRTNGLLGN